MKKERAILIFLVATIALSYVVMAAGSSTGNSNSNSNANSNENPVQVPTTPSTLTTCENFGTTRDRIKCRFQNRAVAQAEASNITEEACRGHARGQACAALYRRSAKCYDISASREKKKCFLEEAGININAGGTFRAAPEDTKRNYVILLLYELQERIEKMQERGTLTADESASLVTKIVEIKKLILEDKPRSEIVPKMQNFKKEYKTTIGGAQ